MLTKRIIPCLDIKDGRTVKGIHFENVADAGDPVELAEYYSLGGADELVFLDISATSEKRKTLASLVDKIAAKINIPFTVGGGISTAKDAALLLEAGADKISINSAAVENPDLIDELASAFGSQFIVMAIDAKEIENQWIVHTHGGKRMTGLKLQAWAKESQERGAGEILFTSMDHDGTKNGFAKAPLRELHELLTIPVIASGGGGNENHFYEVFAESQIDAALAASIFHFGEVKISSLKSYLHKQGITVRL